VVVRALIPGRRQRPHVAAVACAAFLALLFAAPSAAAAKAPVLSGAVVTPASGQAGDAFTLSVVYRSSASERGRAPAEVTVALDAGRYPMAPVDSTDTNYRDGALFRVVLHPGAGRYAVVFSATDLDGRAAAALPVGDLVVTAKPAPTPRPTPRPTPAPQPTPRVTPRPTVAPAQAPGGNGPTSQPSATAGPDATESAATASPTPTSSPSGAVAPTAVASPSIGPAGGSGSINAPGSDGDGAASLADLTGLLPPVGSPAWVELMVRQAALATGVTTMMAMALFAFRRRQEDGDDGSDPGAVARYEPPASLADQLADHYVVPLAVETSAELLMPRWRRPSLRAAREAKTIADPRMIEAERLTFQHGVVDPEPGLERRRVRYRLVRLGDAPDELLSNEIGRLDEGDEVELLGRSGVHWQVRTPLGAVGWVHKMTLGEAVVAGRAADDAPAPEADGAGDGLAQRLVEGQFQL
jgi:hypothetical protein